MGYEIFKSLRKKPFKPYLVDYGLSSTKVFTRGLTLALSLQLVNALRKLRSPDRVGVALPPGLAGFVANFALLLSGRVVVNLNYTLGSGPNLEMMESARVSKILTASKMIQKFPDFPWPDDCFLVDDFLKVMAGRRWTLARTLIWSWFFPGRVIKQFEIAREGGSRMAALLFTSGSSGKPKGVPLSHANLLANCDQLYDLKLFHNQPSVLANLPLFHSFGLTVGMIFSTLRGLYLVTAPTPLDHKLNVRIIKEKKVRILMGTPTFLRGYLEKGSRSDLKSLDYVVAGAERSPRELRNRWERETNCEYLEGYGLTETSPAISFNQPGAARRCGSVGRLLEGIECKTIDPETRNCLPSHARGVLCFRGPNVFSGYLESSRDGRKDFDEEGWFVTGDLGRVDEDGFLWIEGRVSRFSKIGGEMVSHLRVEEEINKALDICPGDHPQLVVSSTQDQKKGEKLVVLSCMEVDFTKVRESFQRRGIPNLWLPRIFVKVEQIPVLSTGKVDWSEIRVLAEKQESLKDM